MRTMSAEALTEISKVYGLEPIIIVRVFWNEVPFDYSDKAVADENILGGLLEISSLEDSFELPSTNQSISVKLDDSEGNLRNIIDANDIHKKRVQVLQWFTGRPKSDAFVILDGQINTPIEWSEGERTLSFTIISFIEDRELGFSFEEGQFPNLPSNLVGKNWPIVFGNVLKIPALQITETPSGVVAEGFSIVYDDVYEAELGDLLLKIQEAARLLNYWMTKAYEADLRAGDYLDGYPDPDDSIDTYNQYKSQMSQSYQTANDYYAEIINLQTEATRVYDDWQDKKRYRRNPVRFVSWNFPRGRNVTVEINSSRFAVNFDGILMRIIREIVPEDLTPRVTFLTNFIDSSTSRRFESRRSTEKFKWIDAGTRIDCISEPLSYILALGDVSIQGVFSRTKGILAKVPTDLYTLSTQEFTNEAGSVVKATCLTLKQPLTTIKNDANEPVWETNDLWSDINSNVEGKWSAIVQWSVENFSNLGLDPTTFAEVSAYTDNQPMNFVILDRLNTLNFIKDLCFQARVSVWVNDLKLNFRYLPTKPTPVESIGVQDIDENSLILTCTDTESLYTKLIANWMYQNDSSGNGKVITRCNVAKYGIRTQEYNYFAYNHVELVRRSLQFWAFRLGTSWKIIKFKTFLHKLKIEANDSVTIEASVLGVEVVGTVLQASYDSSTNKIDMVVWLPIRWGETSEYSFAYTADTQDLYNNTYPEFKTGNPFQDVQDNGFVAQSYQVMSSQWSTYNPFAILDDSRTFDDPATTSTALTNTEVNYGRPNGLGDANNRNIYDIKTVADLPPVTIKSGQVDIGLVTEALEEVGKYKVQLIEGSLITATQLLISEDYKVPVGMPVVVVLKNKIYYMQSPVWSNE